MARSCTPPPLSDRKKLVANAQRRRSQASSSVSRHTDGERDDGDSTDEDDAMEVEETLEETPTRNRSGKQSEDTEPDPFTREKSVRGRTSSRKC